MKYHPRWGSSVQTTGVPFGSGGSARLSMTYGMPDPDLFPAAGVAEAAATALARPELAATALQYGRIQGQPDFISLLADRLCRNEGLQVRPENLLVASGSSSAIGLVARTFLDRGDIVLVEAPSFPGAMSIFERMGARLCPLPIGAGGIDIEGAEQMLNGMRAKSNKPKLLYTMPTFHNPLGGTLDVNARKSLLDLAGEYDLLVLEDDAYRDLYYDADSGALPPSLYALDTEGRVVRTGTFSKILSPGMRLGWALAQPEVIKRMMLVKDEGGTSPFAQQTAVEYARSGALDAHIATLVEAYRAKRDAMLAALDHYFPQGPEIGSWTTPAGGFFVWVTLPNGIDPAQLAALAAEQDVDYMPGESCFPGEGVLPDTYMRLSYSTLNTVQIEEAIDRLSRAVSSLSKG
ncbi:MAG TPA: PLP-dependent aminotransferase family protein [Chloroflexia bacterium]|nr:PLP-dependent aminotransferase family protein [Chloroflexia bacterium]